MSREIQTDFWPQALASLTFIHEHATLRKCAAEPKGESQPPWAETSFSYRFTGLPPLEAYEEML